MSDVQAVIKTPYQGLNKLLGPEGGFLPGTMVLVSSLQYQYRCGLVTDILLGDLLYGETTPTDVILNVTPHLNQHTYRMDLYRRYAEVTGDYHVTHFNEFNLHNEIYSTVDGETKITIYDIMSFVTAREKEGINVRMLVISDLSRISLVDINGRLSNIVSILQELREFISKRKTVMITSFPDNSNYGRADRWFENVASGASSLAHEVDCEIKVKTYSNCMKFTVPKHHGTTPLNMQARYNTIPGCLPEFDINDEDKSILYGSLISEVKPTLARKSGNASGWDPSKGLDIGVVFSEFLKTEEKKSNAKVNVVNKDAIDLELELTNVMNSDVVNTYINISAAEVIELLELYGAGRYEVFVKNSYLRFERDFYDGGSLEISWFGKHVPFNEGTLIELFLELEIPPDVRLDFMVKVITALATMAAVIGTKKYIFNE